MTKLEMIQKTPPSDVRFIVLHGELVTSTFGSLDKVVVGSYMGMLRIFSPHASKSSEEVPADAQLLEVQLQNAIIQVELGKFVS